MFPWSLHRHKTPWRKLAKRKRLLDASISEKPHGGHPQAASFSRLGNDVILEGTMGTRKNQF